MGLLIIGQFAWALGVCAAFVGWGAALSHLLGLRIVAGRSGALGVAFAVVCGGLINLLQVMSVPVAVGFVFAGLGLGSAVCLSPLAGPPLARLPREWGSRALLGVVVLLAGIAIAGYAYTPEFHDTDDYSGYLAFPQKLLAMGSLGFEPFSERRLGTGVGGLYFLQALISAGAGIFFLHSIDPALGLALVLLLLEEAMRRRGVRAAWRLGVLLLALLLPRAVINLTASLLPMALMLCLCLLLEDDADAGEKMRGPARVVALALVAAAIVALKSAYITWVGSFLVLVFATRIVGSGFARRAFLAPLAVAAMTLLMLAPWLAANLRDAGTIMFPILGYGFHASRYGLMQPPWAAAPPGGYLAAVWFEAGKLGPTVAAAWVTFVLFVLLARRAADHRRAPDRRRGDAVPTAALLCSGLVFWGSLAWGTGFVDEVPRYAYPGVLCGLLAAAYRWTAADASRARAGLGGRGWARGGVIGACALLAVANWQGLYQYYGHAVTNAGMAMLGPGFRPAMLAGAVADEGGRARAAVARMQRAIPPGATVLERLDYPFLLDFSRNNVLIADWPGEVSPPPGMPLFQGPEKLADYLLRAQVRFVAYDYAHEAAFPAARIEVYFGRGNWIETEVQMAIDFQRNLAALMRTRRLLYEDDARAVIDLAEPAERFDWAGRRPVTATPVAFPPDR